MLPSLQGRGRGGCARLSASKNAMRSLKAAVEASNIVAWLDCKARPQTAVGPQTVPYQTSPAAGLEPAPARGSL